MLAAMLEESKALPQRLPSYEGTAFEQIVAHLPKIISARTPFRIA
jgi:hypothetical protein